MKKEKISAFALCLMAVMSFCGCEDKLIDLSHVSIQDIGGGGSCLFVNQNTKDSVLIKGGITITIGSSDKINVHNGDLLEMKFIPESQYEKYNFTVTYTLMDGTQHSCTNYDYTYKFTVSDWGSKNGKASFSAKYNVENINITAGGSIGVVLVDNNE
ncbi:MAG: hypothetical protein J6K41_04525 [Paraprevotella sp.]|nr:hypothetical protein [Paraprevotella sp.]